ncbi:hypothetical protein R3P38DRAFT_3604946 [Favolaschia claudopus]|uniref:Uncharacterized protein n=1 Tax=Favolaschia claudopus TaxID=2862362 RepID=A0AAW0A9N1_9AGAR
MPPRRRIDSEEPTTPERPRTQGPLANILNVFQQITPSKSDRDIRGLREDLQPLAIQWLHRKLANEAEDVLSAKDSEIADLSNQVVPTKNRRRRKRFHRADDADDSRRQPVFLEERPAFFIDEVDIWTNEAEDEFDYATEFNSKTTRVQAQIQDLLRLLPNDARSRRTQEWFVDGMGGQRSAAVHRIRHASLAHLSAADELKHFATASDRFEHFKDRVGYVSPPPRPKKPSTPHSRHQSSTTSLTGNLTSTISSETLYFLRFMPASCVVPTAPMACSRSACRESTTSLAPLLADAAVLAIWLYSADTKFQRRGDQTDINYVQRHMDYVEQLRKALTSKKAWVIDLLKYWDDILFPDADNDDGGRTRW